MQTLLMTFKNPDLDWPCSGAPAVPDTAEGSARLHFPGFRLGPCLGRSKNTGQGIPGCSAATVLSYDDHWEFDNVTQSQVLWTYFQVEISGKKVLRLLFSREASVSDIVVSACQY